MRGVAEENGRLWQELERLRAMVGSPAVWRRQRALGGLEAGVAMRASSSGGPGVFERPGDKKHGQPQGKGYGVSAGKMLQDVSGE